MKHKPPRTVNMHQAKTNLSELVELATQGVPIVLARSGQPVARIVPIDNAPLGTRPVGLGRGKALHAGFLERSLAPMTPDELEGWDTSIYPDSTETLEDTGLAPHRLHICLILSRSPSGANTVLVQGLPSPTPQQAFDSLLETLEKTSKKPAPPWLPQLKSLHHEAASSQQGPFLRALDPQGHTCLVNIELPFPTPS